ncbi:MAG: gliding motility-associated C-terminal domain-containing protein [Flavobacteriales bacterium]|nr:gliding motility-associated C-terminal domain-containing protein [Flavobacteriales bacterium]
MLLRVKTIVFLLLFQALLVPRAWAQVFLISQGNATTCSGALLDSGGEGGSGYGDNENYVMTICSSDPDSAISLSFIIFNLSGAGSAPADQISIYDGPDTSAPLIGTWSGTSSPGIVNASFANTSGCLTVQFTSNETGVGIFAASITCSQPCEPPTAIAQMSEAAPALICQGEVVGFDATGSYAAAGFNVEQYLWDFGDGTMDSTSGPILDHVFQGPPQQFVVNLIITDDNGCVNTNSMQLPVQVSIPPTYDNFEPITFCSGESVNLTATTSITPSTWTSIPDANFGGGIMLPDQLGTPFTSSITFEAFPPGATLPSVNEFLSVCVSMEHSFMGDFTLQLTAPNGTSVMLHQQGGGGTYLGIPNDFDEGNPQIGTCWDYCFSPTATNGTWAANAGGGSLPAGTYQAVGAFSALAGTSLNGTWTLTFNDWWGADNGFICSWGINFDPSILPDDVSYTPIPGIAHSDSSYWSGPALTNDPLNPLEYIASPTQVGSHVYTYTVTDNFGCTYDTTLTINVTPGVNADPYMLCGAPILLQPGLQLPLPLGTITYQWSPAAGLSNTNTPYPTANPTVPTWYTLHAFPAGHPLCGNVDSVFVNPPSLSTNVLSVTDHMCHGGLDGYIAVASNGTNGPWNYFWTDSAGAIVQTTMGAYGDTLHAPAGTYQVLIQDGPNGNGCEDSLTTQIQQPPQLLLNSISADTTICLDGTAQLGATATGGSGSLLLHWGDGATGGTVHSVSPSVSTVYRIFATDTNNCHSDTLAVAITVRDSLHVLMADTVVSCPEVNVLLATDSAYGGDGQYSFDWGQGPLPFDTLTVNLAHTTTYCMTLHDGCETPPVTRCTTVEVLPLPPLILNTDTVLGCVPFLVQFELVDTTNGGHADWRFGDGVTLAGGPMSLPHLYMQYGTFDMDITVHWPNGCSADSLFSDLITVIDMPHAAFTWTPQPADIFHNEVHFMEQAGPTATAFLWDFAGLASSTAPDTSITFTDAYGSQYRVQLNAWNELGCMDSVIRLVNVDDVFLVHVPTAFTPDGDNLNEVLYVEGNDIADAEYRFRVFNRWGELIFETTDRKVGWDGTYKGKKVPVGVYNWTLHAQSVYTKTNHDLQGHVTVVK